MAQFRFSIQKQYPQRNASLSETDRSKEPHIHCLVLPEVSVLNFNRQEKSNHNQEAELTFALIFLKSFHCHKIASYIRIKVTP